MDSGSTPGNPYTSEGEDLDIFQNVPYNMPIMRRSAKFQQRKHTSRRCETFRFEIEKRITPSSIDGKAEKKK